MSKSSSNTKTKKQSASGTGAPAKAAKASPAEQKRAREEEAKQKAEQEAARKKHIQDQITVRNSQIQILNSNASALRNGRGRIAASIEAWNVNVKRYRQNPINAQIEVKGMFEGEAASGMSTRNRYYIAVMDTKVSRALSIHDRLMGQEQRISSRIGTLSSEITGLRAQL